MVNSCQSFINGIITTLTCELRLFLRNAGTSALLALFVGICILILPDSEANYTIVSFGSAKPIMTASIFLVTAGVVLATLLFPYYLLTMGIGQERDQNLSVDTLFLNIAHTRFSIIIGRTAASFVKIIALSFLLCLLLTLILTLKLGFTPGAEAALIFLLLVTSSGFATVGFAMIIEHIFVNHRTVMLMGAFALWIGSLVVYVFFGWDLYGFSVLESALPAQKTDTAVSFGIIAGENLTTFEWSVMPQLTTVFALVKKNLLFTSVSIGIALLLLRVFKRKLGRKAIEVKPMRLRNAAIIADISQHLSPPTVRFYLLSSFIIELGFILTKYRLFALLAVIVLVTGVLVPNGAQLAIPGILATLFFIFRGRQMIPGKTTYDLENALAPLQYPNPQILRTLAISFLIAAPLLPILFRLDAGRVVVLLSAILFTSGWLMLTFQKWRRPLLGMSVFALFWYAVGLNTIHPRLDLLALQSFSLSAMLINFILLACVMSALTTKRHSFWLK